MAAAGLGLALVAGAAVAPATVGPVAPASAAPTVWYYITGYSQADCSATVTKYRGWGARIVTACHKRSYDQKWAFSYYWIN